MIQIGPLYTFDKQSVISLLEEHGDYLSFEISTIKAKAHYRGLSFWQHWLPCNLHIDSLVYVAKEDTQVLGFLALGRLDKVPNSWRIEQLIIHPDHRHRGIANELINFISAIYGSQGVRSFNFEIDLNNSTGLRLLANKGFSKQAEIAYYLKDSNFSQNDLNSININLAKLADKSKILELYQLSLPYRLREIYGFLTTPTNQTPIFELNYAYLFSNINHLNNSIWIFNDSKRNILQFCAQIFQFEQNTYLIEFNIHPGFADNFDYFYQKIIKLVLNNYQCQAAKSPGELKLIFKTYDYQPALLNLVKSDQLSLLKTNILLIQEHWSKSKAQHKFTNPLSQNLSPITKPAVFMPKNPTDFC